MASNKAKRHVHKYHHVTLSIGKVWACALPDCNHYMPQYLDELVQGKASYCWNCNEKIILDPLNMKSDTPFCENCMAADDEPSLMKIVQ